MKVVIQNEGERIVYKGPLQYTSITRVLNEQQQIDFFNLLINKGNGRQICKIINQQSFENALNQNVAQEIIISLKEIVQQIDIEEDEQEEQQKLEQQQSKVNKQSQQQAQQLIARQQNNQQKIDNQTNNKESKKAKRQTPKQKRQTDIKKTFNRMAKLMQNHIDKLVKKKIKAMIPSIKQQIIMQLQQKKQQQKQLSQSQQQDKKEFTSGQHVQNIIIPEQTKSIQHQTKKPEQPQQKVEKSTQQQIKGQQGTQQTQLIEKKNPKPDNKTQFYNELQKLIKMIYQQQRQQQQEQIAEKKAKRKEKMTETVKQYLQREKQKNQARQKEKIQQRCLKLSKIYCTNSSFFTKYVESTLQLPLKQMIEHYALTQQSSIPQLQQKMAMKRQQKYKKLCQYFNKFKPQYHSVVEKYPNLSINQLIEILCQNGIQTYVQQIHGLIKNEELTNKNNINKKIVKQLGKEDSWVQLQCSYNEKQSQGK